MIKHDKISGNNVPTNVKNIQHEEKDGERQNLNYCYRCRGVQCLKCQGFEHIKFGCSRVSKKQRKTYHVFEYKIDEEGGFNQGNNVVTFKDMKERVHIDEPSNSKCIPHIQKEDYTITYGQKDYQCINFVSFSPLYYCKLYGRQPHHQHMYPQWNEKFQRHHQQAWHGKPNILVYIDWSSHKVFSYEDYVSESICNRHLIEERNYVTLYDSNKRYNFVNMKMAIAIVEHNVEDHVSDIMEDMLETETEPWYKKLRFISKRVIIHALISKLKTIIFLKYVILRSKPRCHTRCFNSFLLFLNDHLWTSWYLSNELSLKGEMMVRVEVLQTLNNQQWFIRISQRRIVIIA